MIALSALVLAKKPAHLSIIYFSLSPYTLSASNEFGSADAIAEVEVSSKPFAAYSFDLATAEDSAVGTSATATATGAGPPALIPGQRRHGGWIGSRPGASR